MKLIVTLVATISLKTLTTPTNAGIQPACCEVLPTALCRQTPSMEGSPTLKATTALIAAATLVASPASIEPATPRVKTAAATVAIHDARLIAPPHDRVT
jgi:hypothetical protein